MEGPMPANSEQGAASTPPPDGTAAIMAKLWAGFQAIGPRIDALDARLNLMNESIDLQAARMDGAERRILDVED
ncbi:hypothetical protein NDU88_004465 [Pleurodeles waltl]|uniref:Uncharacterized protein n=1 Tax=Pleurodeles waltl TaxID=8319 RepID=A0AAV7PF41_PLEWA|nr:hypothetical protein NDU88_004465 [Pleurodeles waltl]